MKNFILISVIWVLLLPCSVKADAVSGNLTVVVPPDKAITESELISIVLRLAGNAVDQVQISINNRKQPLIAKPHNQHYACKDGIQLSYGINKIKVVGLKDGKKVEEITTQIFYKTGLTQIPSAAPPGFKQYSFHVDFHEKNCTPCHQLEFSKIDAKMPSGERSPCFTCHKKMLTNYAFVHGPAAVWSCLMCHDGKSRDPKLAVQKPDEKVCVNCHENSWENKKYQQDRKSVV